MIGIISVLFLKLKQKISELSCFLHLHIQFINKYYWFDLQNKFQICPFLFDYYLHPSPNHYYLLSELLLQLLNWSFSSTFDSLQSILHRAEGSFETLIQIEPFSLNPQSLLKFYRTFYCTQHERPTSQHSKGPNMIWPLLNCTIPRHTTF